MTTSPAKKMAAEADSELEIESLIANIVLRTCISRPHYTTWYAFKFSKMYMYQLCLCVSLTTEYLKDNKYTAAELAFAEECPYVSTDDESRPSESLEEIVGIYRRQKQSGKL